jgi:PAS domain S-box-containing protein
MAGEKILIVEDNPTNLKLENLLLSIENYEVRNAVDASSALEVLKTFNPQLILMDLQLPIKNGLDFTRELKADPKYKDICIVALTAYAMKDDEEKAKAAGCDGFMTKPISAVNFPLEIRRYLQENMKTVNVKEQTSHRARILIVEDNPISRKVLKLSLEKENYIVVEAEDGASALMAANSQEFDLIIQDLALPDMKGFLLNKKLRDIKTVKDIPIFALSGFIDPLDTHDNQSGFTKYLIKPIKQSYLLEVVKAHLPLAMQANTSMSYSNIPPVAEVIDYTEISEQAKSLAAEFDKMRFSEMRYRKIVELAPYAIFILENEKIIYANNIAIKTLAAKSVEELFNYTLYDFLLPEYQAIVLEAFKQNRNQLAANNMQVKLKNINGEILAVEILLTSFFDMEPSTVCVFMMSNPVL